jgi:hypothetical protein
MGQDRETLREAWEEIKEVSGKGAREEGSAIKSDFKQSFFGFKEGAGLGTKKQH